MKAYIAAPLFNEMEKQFNLQIDAFIQSLGLETYLPQRDGGEATKLVKQGASPAVVGKELFEIDVREVHSCDILIFVLDGRVPDEGACVELGMAYALGKKCIGFKTDARCFAMSYNNLMIDHSLNGGLALSWDELRDAVLTTVKALEKPDIAVDSHV